MRPLPRWLGVALRMGARRTLASPGALVVSVFFYVVVVFTVTQLWRVAAGDAGGLIDGYSRDDLTWYLATSEAAIIAIFVRLIEQIGNEIASGEVATELLRPAPVVGIRLASQIGESLPRLAILATAGFVISWRVAGPPPDGVALGLAVPSLVLAICCNLAAIHAIAGLAFWIRDARSGWFIYQKMIFILGGMLLPLQVLPDALHRIASTLPFLAMAYAPARLASGHVEPHLLAVQAGWLVVLLAAATAVFAAGERRLQVVGG